MQPSPRVLDLFAVPGDLQPLPGGSGETVRAGDLVLSPGRDTAVLTWLAPVLARLAVRLDEDPRRTARDLRVALPVPARDGSWAVDGWGATRFEPGCETCGDLEVTRRAGRLLHAHLASAVPTRPPLERTDRWAVAERAAFGEGPAPEQASPAAVALAEDAVRRGAGADLGPDQLVHADLAGNVLLDLAGAPLVVDVSPAWRPVLWAEAVCVLDAVLWWGAPPGALEEWRDGPERAAMQRAVAFRVLSDQQPDVAAYEAVLHRT